MTTSLRVELDDATGPGIDALHQRLDDLARSAEEVSRRLNDLSHPLGEEAGVAFQSRLRAISDRMAKLAESRGGQSPSPDETPPLSSTGFHSPFNDTAPRTPRNEHVGDPVSHDSSQTNGAANRRDQPDMTVEAMASQIAEAVWQALQRLVDRFEARPRSPAIDTAGQDSSLPSDIADRSDSKMRIGTQTGSNGPVFVPNDDNGVAALATAVEQQSNGFASALRSQTAAVQRAIRTVETVANELLAVQQTVAGHAAALQQIEQSVAAGSDRMRSQRWGGR